MGAIVSDPACLLGHIAPCLVLPLPGSIRAARTIRAMVNLVAARLDFGAENRYLPGRLDADLDDIAANSSHLQPDGVPMMSSSLPLRDRINTLLSFLWV